MRWWSSIVCGLLSFSTLACSSSQALAVSRAASPPNPVVQTAAPEIKQVSPQQAYQFLQAQPTAQFIDVRQPDEYAEGHAKGTRLRPLNELPRWAGTLKQSDPVVLICRSGNRSQIAAEELKKRGFRILLNIQGGTPAWEAQGLPVEQ
ncbi:MAG: rhodanese-like domain-containing protein [Candidatus Sericytochromatia bacterium]|nr:rhodanese-like domain-containing protein [Candidatus Sericytochromatia bacterium]